MIPCGKCNADNMVGAIFCRSCGEKLELDNIAPETLSRKSESMAKNIGGIIRRVVGALVLIVVLWYLIGLFLPAKGLTRGEFDEAGVRRLTTMYTHMHRNSGGPRYKMDADELTWVANHAVGLDKKSDGGSSDGAALAPIKLSLNFLPGEKVRVVLESQAFGKMSVYTTAIGKFEIPDGADKITFKPYEVRVGKMKIPRKLHSKVLDRIIVLTDEKPELDVIRGNVAGVDFEDDSMIVRMKRPAGRRRR